MDAIDELRLRVATLEARTSIMEGGDPALRNELASLTMRFLALESEINQVKMHTVSVNAVSHGLQMQVGMMQQSMLRLVNQSAIVAATLGSAIFALKRGDSHQSEQALQAALDSQDRLGAMLNELGGKPK